MSKKALLLCASLVGACFAENTQTDIATEVHELPGIRIENGPVVVEPSYGCSEENITALADATVRALYATLSDVAATVHKAVAEVQVQEEQVVQAEEAGLAAQQQVTTISETPAAVEVAAVVVETTVAPEVVAAPAEEANKVEKASEEIGEAVEAVHNVVTEVSEAVSAVHDAVFNGSITGDYIPAIMDFISSYYTWLITFFKKGWAYMVYNSVNKATRHIVLSAASRSPVDLSALAQVDAFAGECFAEMAKTKALILEAAEQRSPQVRKAMELYLGQYEEWFRGSAEGFVDLDATRAMLGCLGVNNVDAAAFTTRNMEHFRSAGGEIRHSNLFLVVSPGDIARYEATPFIAQNSEELPTSD